MERIGTGDVSLCASCLNHCRIPTQKAIIPSYLSLKRISHIYIYIHGVSNSLNSNSHHSRGIRMMSKSPRPQTKDTFPDQLHELED